MKRIKLMELLNRVEGKHSINAIMAILKVNKNKAVYYIHRLRKKGYVKTRKDKNNKRIYDISFDNKLGGKSYVDIINENSPIKVYSSQDYRIYGKINLEEALVFAIKSKNLRMLISSLALFKKIHDWKLLYNLGKSDNINREICALYELSRKIMKTRKISERFKNFSLPEKNAKYKYIIEGLKSGDFKDIEKKWKIYIPLNINDLNDYKK